MSGRVSKGTGLTRVGDFELLKEFAAPITKQEEGILSAAIEVQAQPNDEVNFLWQGGEPTLAGLDY